MRELAREVIRTMNMHLCLIARLAFGTRLLYSWHPSSNLRRLT